MLFGQANCFVCRQRDAAFFCVRLVDQFGDLRELLVCHRQHARARVRPLFAGECESATLGCGIYRLSRHPLLVGKLSYQPTALRRGFGPAETVCDIGWVKLRHV